MAVAARPSQRTGRGYPDLREHLEALDRAGLLVRVRRPMLAETEIHPLVRWQYRGGLPEEDWKAFLFEDVRTVKGGRSPFRVGVGVQTGLGPQVDQATNSMGKAVAGTQGVPTGIGWGVPLARTVTSQPSFSSRRRRAARVPNSLWVSISMR